MEKIINIFVFLVAIAAGISILSFLPAFILVPMLLVGAYIVFTK